MNTVLTVMAYVSAMVTMRIKMLGWIAVIFLGLVLKASFEKREEYYY
jgi:hypothetical protein